MSGTTVPNLVSFILIEGPVVAIVRAEPQKERRRLTVMIGADLQRLVSSHDQPSLVVLFVLEQSYIASPTLLPLSRVAIKAKELGAHLEGLFLELFVGLRIYFLCKVHDRLEVDFWRLWRIILRETYNQQSSSFWC